MLRHLRIHRPLVFTDIETTGLDPQYDRIVEIALMKLVPGAEVRELLEIASSLKDRRGRLGK